MTSHRTACAIVHNPSLCRVASRVRSAVAPVPAHQMIKRNAHGSTRNSPRWLWACVPDDNPPTPPPAGLFFTFYYTACLRHPARGSILTSNGWLLSRPGSTRSPRARHRLTGPLRAPAAIGHVPPLSGLTPMDRRQVKRKCRVFCLTLQFSYNPKWFGFVVSL